MKFSDLTDSTIRELHEDCHRAYESDRSEGERLSILGLAFNFGVDENVDWTRHVRALETEMQRRNMDFTPIEV